MENLKLATAQFENRSADKGFNLSVIEKLSGEAAAMGAQAIAFHECSVTGYSFASGLSKQALLAVAEPIPDGQSVQELIRIARTHSIIVLAGLFERDEHDTIYNSYVCVDGSRVISKFRKLHPFINPHIAPGDQYCVFDLLGWKCGILICYDNNIVENVRATNLLGADLIFMPHVTMCTPSTRPGAGFVDPKLWNNREADPTSLRLEFDGAKGRQWLLKWLPARAYDNAIYAVFANAIGMERNQLKNGCSMIVDPFGDVIAECRKLDSDIALATLTPEKLTQAGGYRYKKARRPNLYRDIIGAAHTPEQKVAWLAQQQRPHD